MKEKLVFFSSYALVLFLILNVLFYGFEFLEYYRWSLMGQSSSMDAVSVIVEVTQPIHLVLVFVFLLFAPLWAIFSCLHFKEGQRKNGFLYLLITVIFVSMFWPNYEPFELFMRFYNLFYGHLSNGGGSIGYTRGPLIFGVIGGALLCLLFFAFKLKSSKNFIDQNIRVAPVFKNITNLVFCLHSVVALFLAGVLISPVMSISSTPRLLRELENIVSGVLPLILLLAVFLLILVIVLLIWGKIKYCGYLKKTFFSLLVLDIVFISCSMLWIFTSLIAGF